MSKPYLFLIKALIILAFIPNATFAQNKNTPVATEQKVAPNNWYQLDKETTGYYGISLDKAYDFLKGKKSKTIIVAVIDSGIDTLQEDLKPILWVNPGEIPGNGIDDDHNGYIDDVHGWNFLGGKDGRNVKKDSYEAARVYWHLHAKYENKTEKDTLTMSPADKREFATYLRAQTIVVDDIDPQSILILRRILPMLKNGDSILGKELGKSEFTGSDLVNFFPVDQEAQTARSFYLNIAKQENNYAIPNTDIISQMDGELSKGETAVTPPENYRNDIVKDDYNNINDSIYGNTDIMTGSPMHGTHCSGIIGAVRNNGLGIDGIADNVRIMMVRAVPDGDEHDKDIAVAIRYAVDNGAQVISMSFGKPFSPQKQWVDDAVKYAESRGVLLVHAAGNDAEDIDTAYNFPNPIFQDGSGRATNMITVGASGDPTNGGITASFSNYGKKEVDVFAPGVNIYSTLPGGDKYGNASGTSMAAPVVAAISALILEYYPTLTPQQIIYVIKNSVMPISEKVKLPGTDDLVNLSDISVAGGIANAYNALKLAATIKGERVVQNETLPKSKEARKRKN